MSQLLQACRDNGSLRTQAQIHDPVLGNHGDLCVLGGFKADLPWTPKQLLPWTTTAKNHDSQQKPYGICWSMAHAAATPKIPTKPYEDEEDEDNGFTQSLAVTTQASSSADGGVAQSMTVPQQARSKSENYGVAQSLTVTTQARWSNAAEMDTDMEFSLLVSERLRRRLKWSASPNAGDHEQGESATSLLEGFPSGPPLLIANTPARAENVAKSVPQRSPPRKSSAIQTYHHSLAPNPTHHRSLASASHKRFWSSSSEPDNKRKARENFDEDIAQTRRRTGSWH